MSYRRCCVSRRAVIRRRLPHRTGRAEAVASPPPQVKERRATVPAPCRHRVASTDSGTSVTAGALLACSGGRRSASRSASTKPLEWRERPLPGHDGHSEVTRWRPYRPPCEHSGALEDRGSACCVGGRRKAARDRRFVFVNMDIEHAEPSLGSVTHKLDICADLSVRTFFSTQT